jgi:hypothetical protein
MPSKFRHVARGTNLPYSTVILYVESHSADIILSGRDEMAL